MEDVWTMKRELPDFMGTDPVGWISAAEKFFEKNKIHSEDELQRAFMSMEDEGAMLWFYYWCEENPDADWNSPSMTMTREFGAQMVQNQESKPKLWKVTETHDEPKLEEMNFTVEREAKGYAKVESDSKEIVDIVIETDYRKRGAKAKCDRRMNKMQRRKEQVFVFGPPPLPEPPDTVLYVVANEIQIIQAVVVELRPPPEPPNADSHAQISSSSDLQGRKTGFHGLLNFVFDRGKFLSRKDLAARDAISQP